MKRIASMLVSGLAILAFVPAASAHQVTVAKHGHAAKIRHGGDGHHGYWRPGPKTEYGFGFATYRGDPFGKDDYYDRSGCYYLHHKDFCLDFTPPRGYPH